MEYGHPARLVFDTVVHNDLCALLRLYGWYWYHATGGESQLWLENLAGKLGGMIYLPGTRKNQHFFMDGNGETRSFSIGFVIQLKHSF